MKQIAIWMAAFAVLMAGCSGDKESESSNNSVDKAVEYVKLPPAEHLADVQKRFTDTHGEPRQQNEPADKRMVRQELTKEALWIAEQNPDDPTAVKALVWIMEVNNPNRYTTDASNLVKERYLDSPDIAGFVSRLMGKEALEYISENNPDETVKAIALYHLGSMIAGDSNPDVAATADEIMQRIIDEFPNASYGGRNFKDLAGAFLFKARLNIGKVAPDIEGVDTDEEPFKLSDYKGKVVMLDFWGDW